MSPSSPAGSSSSSLPDSNALLALPDGPIPANHPDRSSHLVSLIGGYPTFPSFTTPPTSSTFTCRVCLSPIPLLSQVYCPPEGGENDRTIYIFACQKGSCQRKEGSVRAWRASKRNEEYVRDVESKRAEKEKEEKRLAEERRKNPFTMGNEQPVGSALFGGTPASGAGLFGAANPFAAPSSSPPPSSPSPATAQSKPEPDLSTLSISSPTTTTLLPPHPAYQPPQYLSTTDEYLPPPSEIDIDSDDGQSPEEKAEWRDERFEQLLPSGIDPLFERFVKRISEADGASTQVLRYDLGGYPLPYSTTSSLTTSLFPGLAAALRAQKAEDEDPSPGEYYKPSPKTIPPCPKCKSARVFEVQLVPSLINHLSPDTLSTTGDEGGKGKGKKNHSEEERKRELEKLAKEENGGDGMEWGTIVVFGCLGDCTGFGEEWVGVEWETTLGPQSRQS